MKKMKKDRNRMILRYAQLTALEARNIAEQEEMRLIENQLHFSKEQILIEAGKMALARLPKMLTEQQKTAFRDGCRALREGMEENDRRRKLQ